MSLLLDEIEKLLHTSGKPLSARVIASMIAKSTEAQLGGQTPWKTVGARLAIDIRRNPGTAFMRVGRGMYALRSWEDLIPIDVPRRRVNPLDEEILAVPCDTFDKFTIGTQHRGLHQVDYRELLTLSVIVDRNKAENDTGLVQLIPSFVIFKDGEVLSYKRTRKTPEQRLHDSYSIVFGGHLQPDDRPSLFDTLDEEVERFLFRELYEELHFMPPISRYDYRGILHLNGSSFERQHAAILFRIDLQSDTVVKSLEPGFQSSLRFITWSDVSESPIMSDRWSEACFAHFEEK